MGKYRKKPVVVDAVRFCRLTPPTPELEAFLDQSSAWPAPNGYIIPTLEGDMLARHGDWIIRGVNGEFYPCKPHIFEQTYEAVDEDKPAEVAQRPFAMDDFLSDDGGAAFPLPTGGKISACGLSTHEWFAGQALPAIVKDHMEDGQYAGEEDWAELMALQAIAVADAMIEALNMRAIREDEA